MSNKKSFWRSKIGLSLLLPYLIVSLLTLILISGFIYYAYRNAINSDKQIQKEAAAKGGAEINNYVTNIISRLDFARRTITCAACPDQQNDSIIKNLAESDPSIYSVSVIDKNGKEVSKFNKYNPAPELRDVSKENIFVKAIGANRYASPVYISEYGLPAISMSMPIFSVKNAAIGVLSINVDLSPMWQTAADIKVGRTGYAYVVDGDGKLIAYKDIALVKESADLKDTAGVQNFFSGKDVAEFYPSFTGKTVFGAWQAIPAAGWGVIVELPRKEIVEDLTALFVFAGLVLALLIVFVLIILGVVYVKLLIPVGLLSEGVQSLRDGDLNYRIPLKVDNELGDLADNFNETAATLQSDKQALEQSFHEITEEEAKLVASINSLSSGFIIISRTEAVLISNRVAQELFQTKDGGLSMMKIEKMFSAAFEFTRRFNEVIQTKKSFTADEVPLDKKFLKIVLSPVLVGENGASEIIGVVIGIEDITQAKLLERAEKEFLAIASHEMRTPLTIIRGNIEMLLKRAHEEKETSMLNDIHDGSINLLDIVNNFLDVTSLESNNVQLRKESFDLAELARRAILELSARAGQKNLSLTLIPPPSLPPVFGDRNRTREVLVNLIANAIQYTEKGGVSVAIQPAGRFLKTTITDTGVGIPPNRQGDLFQKFHTVGEQFLHSKEYGSGLGLYISKMIVNASGGTIALEKSEPNVGSTFSFTIPIVDSDANMVK